MGLRAWPLACAKLQAGAVLGVLGVLGVLAKALEREAAKCLPSHRPAAILAAAFLVLAFGA